MPAEGANDQARLAFEEDFELERRTDGKPPIFQDLGGAEAPNTFLSSRLRR